MCKKLYAANDIFKIFVFLRSEFWWAIEIFIRILIILCNFPN